MDREQIGVLVVLLLSMAVATLLSDAFLTPDNLLNLLRQISITGILAFGMTFVIITAGIDLSIGSIVALVSVLVAGGQAYGFPGALAIGLTIGMAAGAVNGAGIAYGRIPPLIMTLASMYLLRGLAFLYSGGLPIYGISEDFLSIGNGLTWGLPNPVIVLLVALVSGLILLRYTVIGRHVFAVGANREAALLSGVHIEKTLLFVYILNGLLAAACGIVYTSQLGIGVALAGQGYELDAIAATVVGGTALAGGRGSIIGAFLGAAIIGIGNNTLNLTGVDPMTQNLLKGLIILGAALLSRVRSRS